MGLGRKKGEGMLGEEREGRDCMEGRGEKDC
jgi:hypothetical protein